MWDDLSLWKQDTHPYIYDVQSDIHRTYIHSHTMRQLDDLQRELEDLRLENRIFKSYYERHASEVATEVDDDKRKTNRQRRRQLPTVLTIEQKVEIGAHEQEVAHKDVSVCATSEHHTSLRKSE